MINRACEAESSLPKCTEICLLELNLCLYPVPLGRDHLLFGRHRIGENLCRGLAEAPASLFISRCQNQLAIPRSSEQKSRT
jgi:hypothetical protein